MWTFSQNGIHSPRRSTATALRPSGRCDRIAHPLPARAPHCHSCGSDLHLLALSSRLMSHKGAGSISQQRMVPRSVLQPPLCAFPTTVGETSHNTHKPALDSLANSASATPTVLQEVSGGEGAKFEPASNSLSSYRSVISHHGGGTSPCSAPRAQPSPAHHRLSASNAAALHHF